MLIIYVNPNIFNIFSNKVWKMFKKLLTKSKHLYIMSLESQTFQTKLNSKREKCISIKRLKKIFFKMTSVHTFLTELFALIERRKG